MHPPDLSTAKPTCGIMLDCGISVRAATLATTTLCARRYKGAWVDGQRSGRGSCKFADDTRYSGMWEHDTFNGRGALAIEVLPPSFTSIACMLLIAWHKLQA